MEGMRSTVERRGKGAPVEPRRVLTDHRKMVKTAGKLGG